MPFYNFSFLTKLRPFIYIFIILACISLSSISCYTPKLTKAQLKNPDAMLDKCRDYFFNNEYYTAINCFEMLIDKFPKYTYNAAWAQYEIGVCYYLEKDYKLARQAFIKVLTNYSIPKQARTLSIKLIRKIDSGKPYKRSSYTESD